MEFVPMELTEKVADSRETEYADAVMVHFDQIDKDVIANLKNCRIIARSAVGYDNIDLNAASEAKIPVTNVPDYCVEEVSNHTLMMCSTAPKKFNQLEANVKKGFGVTSPLQSPSTPFPIKHSACSAAAGSHVAWLLRHRFSV
ncbi:MAG: hypothetical protein V8R75_11865 [Oscillospiraceae bacterium]